MLLQHAGDYGLGMDAMVTVCSWNTNEIMVLYPPPTPLQKSVQPHGLLQAPSPKVSRLDNESHRKKSISKILVLHIFWVQVRRERAAPSVELQSWSPFPGLVLNLATSVECQSLQGKTWALKPKHACPSQFAPTLCKPAMKRQSLSRKALSPHPKPGIPFAKQEAPLCAP